MNLFDLVILAIVALATFGGYRAGFVTRVTSWIGLGLGIAVAVVVAPKILESFNQSGDPQVRVLIAVGVFVIVASLGATVGEMLGAKLRHLIPPGPLRQVDRAVGAVVAGLSVLVLLWLLLPALAEVPGDVAAQVRNSVIARAVDRAAPTAPGPLQTLRNLVQDADFPRVFEGLRPAPGGGAPPDAVNLPAAVVEQVSASTVRVSGPACDQVLEGSGFSPEPNIVVTNAHVVAGVDAVTVQTPAGKRVRAQVLVFDPNRDLAVLQAPGLGEPTLEIAGAKVGDEGAVFGHPGGQVDLEISPSRVVQRVPALGRDIYDNRATRRDVLVLASRLRPGDSGGALVNAGGAVIGVAFAIAPDDANTAYALHSTELKAVLAAPRAGPVDTGPCLH